MKKILFFTFILIFIFDLTHGDAEELVRVRLENFVGDSQEIQMKFTGDYFTLDPTLSLQEGVNYRLYIKNGSLYLKGGEVNQQVESSFLLIPRSYNEEHRVYIDERPYLGAMEFQVENHLFVRPVNQLPLEDYLKGVVPLEVFPSWNIEALKAQALAARTYAVSHLKEDMDDTTFYQVYGGYAWNVRTTKAVDATKGQVITYKNKLIDAFYSASNGGMTENNKNVWGGDTRSFYPIKEDPFDPIHPWEFTLSKTQINLEEIDWELDDAWDSLQEKDQEITAFMKRSINRQGYPGDIAILSIPKFEVNPKRYKSSRSITGSIKVEFLQRLIDGTVLLGNITLEDVNLNRIRPMIGGTIFKSYYIDSLESDDTNYVMKGRGYGHGVGMSQWGASIMGDKGKKYEEIIQFYFPGTTIKNFEKVTN
ncbi:SpoIID/LytB domain-containing protein [Bacillus timonensis]|uniref:SpoIID/LytB domain-containing protein n=1 Tax=Bacillus timonensis TaxID=1033734 RepID=A0A4S3PQM1_9BACI|nr:SpoIID/LytB domain-containing protein [Bacillus timonensis]THE11516.1 SpoIID/LytB domain-containing protein [Bacillus timonensis]